MACSKKNYVAVAARLAMFTRDTGNKVGVSVASAIAEDLTSYFASDNPNFNRARFLAACGVDEAR